MEEKKVKEPNIIDVNIFFNQRYQEFKLDVAKCNFTPTGWNDFGKFKYFQLEDFYEKVMELLAKHGLVYFSPSYDECKGYPRYVARVETYDGMSGHEWEEKVKESNHSKSETQNYGGTITYYERFMLKKIAGIIDKDVIDAIDPSKLEKAPKKDTKATETQVALINQSYDAENLIKIREYYGVNSIKELTVKQASEVLAKKGK